MICLYIWGINPLSVISFTNTFSHSLSCIFILLMVSFAVEKLLSSTTSHLFIFPFASFALGDRSKKVLLRFMSKSVLPMFSCRGCIVSSLIFRCLIHFESIFVYVERKMFYFIILHVIVQFSQHHLLKSLFFLHCIFLPTLKYIN